VTRRARIRIRGRVQGVFFRSEACDRARSLGLAGWVRNNPDGTVEIVCEGDDERVELLLSWCGRGPSGARVDDVEVAWEEPRREDGFSVL
jgi:acylphosphatase